MRFSVIHLKCETTLDTLRSRHGTITNTPAATTARTERNRDAAAAFEEHLLPHTLMLLTAARSAIDNMPPARHHHAWLLLVDDLDHAATQIHRILTDTPPPDSGAAREQHRALWPYLSVWAEHATILTNLVDQHRTPAPEFTGEHQTAWNERAQAAHERGELEPFESWYDARGRLITLAYLVEDDASTVLVLAGDLDEPHWQVLGQDNNEYRAGQLAPPPVPPGVLRPRISRYQQRLTAPEVRVQDLIHDVTVAHHSGDVAEALLTATDDTPHSTGPLAHLRSLIRTAGQFADALDTRQGRNAAAHLNFIARQLGSLTRELHETAEELSAAVGVLPPHRAPHPRLLTAPAAPTTRPPSTASPAAAPVRHR
ncbi:hypothetical protein [Streptomyces sp. IB2014 016-6]|uniref:hypothetical protein n=1 Tax=Streptomyces sp. IB2014 016-6 TaxID=2517818 RepID=UPI0011CA7248|nr:hypothetical protein [Streptomyces sp. IB2014 016-6]TXL84183.1 hypothetical protein EW053_35080 [Streptomyces sp. IB2014 016-6]